MDFGTLSTHSDKTVFRSADTGNFIQVEDMLREQPDTLKHSWLNRCLFLHSEVHQSREKMRVMLHRVVRHKEIEERAFAIYKSPENTDADQNWFHAELELLKAT